MDVPVEQHIKQAVAGDRTALSTLLQSHEPAVRAWLRGTIPQRYRGLLSEEDVLQQAYVDAVRGISGFCGDSQAAFGRWLQTLAKRNLLDALRMLDTDKRGGDRRRVRATAEEDSYLTLLDVLGGSVTSPSGRAAREEARDSLEDALQQLPPTYRDVVQKYDIEGISVEQVAADLERSAGAVYMIRARAHRLLNEILGSASRFWSDPA